ncbi:prohibitin family protein [Laceyella sacchari]|uniref:Prohibitin family protein n=1 Tax=Laceyella sacchari TaxID=37482 RepID=A0ABY5U1K6_LACSH|nr:prohibitin family protein [Laceyella sacchari]UWE02460.1 prohibitin family protein [Laceyella sacchari]
MPVKSHKKRKKQWIGFAAVLVCYILIVLLLGSCLSMVEAGHQGVVFNYFSGVHPQVLGDGLHLHWPWESVTAYPVSTEMATFAKGQAVSVVSKDGQRVQIDVFMSYHLQPARLPGLMQRLHQEDWEDARQQILRGRLQAAMQTVALRHSVVSLFATQRETVCREIEAEVKRELAKDGIGLEGLALTDLRVDERMRQRLQKLVESDIEHQYILRETANKEQLARQRLNEAETSRKVTLIEAQGEAEANRLISQSLTPELMRYYQREQVKSRTN